MSRSTTADPARLAALDVVSRTLAGAYLAPTLRAVLDASTLEGAQRSLTTDLAYGAVRRLEQLDALLAPALDRPDRLPPRVLVALRLGVLDLVYRSTPAHAAVSQWVEVVRAEAPGLARLANAVLRGVERRTRQAGPAVAAEAPALPAWLWGRLVEALGADAAARAAAGMLEPEPLWLTAFSEDAAEALAADGCEVTALPGRWGKAHPLRVRSPLPLDRLAAYGAGLVQPQNPTSLRAALTLAPDAGTITFDLASGRGVKSAVLAAEGADVTAVELSARRSAAAAANLRRLGLEVTHVTADLVAMTPAAMQEAIAKANGWATPQAAPAVLLDAPCSGTGTLRGHPEIKLRLHDADLAELAATQATLLAHAAALVVPGGALVYAVCALTRPEGPGVVGAFLRASPGFVAAELDLDLPSVPDDEGLGRFVLPVDGLDGFYLARLTRTTAPAGS